MQVTKLTCLYHERRLEVLLCACESPVFELGPAVMVGVEAGEGVVCGGGGWGLLHGASVRRLQALDSVLGAPGGL